MERVAVCPSHLCEKLKSPLLVSCECESTGLSIRLLAYKFVVALISANLYPQKQKVKEDTLNMQENLINSNKESTPTIKNTLIPDEPCTAYQNPPPSETGWN